VETTRQIVDIDNLSAHWLLAWLGKRVLRPGELELTRKMLAGPEIGPADRMIELALRLGITAQIILDGGPLTCVGIGQDRQAAQSQHQLSKGPGREVRQGAAQQTGLPEASATVVLGEAVPTTVRSELGGVTSVPVSPASSRGGNPWGKP
jgi:hypothetical protein